MTEGAPGIGAGTPPLPETRTRRRALWALGAALALAVAILFSPVIGSVAFSPWLVLRIVISGGGAIFAPCAAGTVSCHVATIIVWQERVPEVLLAVVAGAALGISGGTLQGIFRNPLADPYLLGISTGGTLGASLVFVYGIGEADANLVLPLFAFLGCVATGGVILLAARGRYGSVETLLLTGVALNALLSSILTIVLLYNPIASLQVDFWLLGGLGNATWSVDGVALGVVLAVGAILAIHGRELNLMQLGNDVAQSAGVDVRRVRERLLLFTALATGTAVAFTGIIGFVGLAAPHVVRRVSSSNYRIVLPGAAIAGAAILLGARDFSLWVLPLTPLPIGIFTSAGGAPFFLYLLYRRRRVTTMGGL
ncbi:MAG TPA: iron ABC transporter permease [Thermoplasmata archaeon]|nr:iron ABC transporter permease [Thermoplasmata archaeon]